MKKVVENRLVIVDNNTGEYAATGDDDYTPDLSNAKLYREHRSVVQLLKYRQTNPKYDLKLVSVKVTVEVLGDSDYGDNVIGEKREKLEEEFIRLDRQATIDIDAMTEKDYRRWKSLRYMMKNDMVWDFEKGY